MPHLARQFGGVWYYIHGNMTGSPIGKSVEAPIAEEHYWIHLTGTTEGQWMLAYRRLWPDRGSFGNPDALHWWETMDCFYEEHEVDWWIHIPYPTSTSHAAPVPQGLEPIHDA